MKLKNVIAAPILLITVLILQAVSGTIDPARLGVADNPYLALVIIQLIVYALPTVFFCRLRGADYAKGLRLRLFRANHLLFMILALIAMIAGSALINLGLFKLFPDSGAGTVTSVTAQGQNLFFSVITFAVLPAITEEFLFRGVILTEYQSVSIPFAVVISSLLFAMMHLNPMRLPTYFFCGILLAIVAYATRSLVAPMLVHLFNNIATLILDRFVYNVAGNTGDRGILLGFILSCVLFVSLVLLFMEAQRIYSGYGVTGVRSPYVRTKKKKEPLGVVDALIAPPFVAFVILFIVISWLNG